MWSHRPAQLNSARPRASRGRPFSEGRAPRGSCEGARARALAPRCRRGSAGAVSAKTDITCPSQKLWITRVCRCAQESECKCACAHNSKDIFKKWLKNHAKRCPRYTWVGLAQAPRASVWEDAYDASDYLQVGAGNNGRIDMCVCVYLCLCVVVRCLSFFVFVCCCQQLVGKTAERGRWARGPASVMFVSCCCRYRFRCCCRCRCRC